MCCLVILFFLREGGLYDPRRCIPLHKSYFHRHCQGSMNVAQRFTFHLTKSMCFFSCHCLGDKVNYSDRDWNIKCHTSYSFIYIPFITSVILKDITKIYCGLWFCKVFIIFTEVLLCFNSY